MIERSPLFPVQWLTCGYGLISIGLLCLTLLAFVRGYWFCELLSNVTHLFLIVSIVLITVTLFRMALWPWALIAACAAVLNAYLVLPVLWQARPLLAPLPAPVLPLTVMSLNMYKKNEHVETVLTYIERLHPDILGLSEVRPAFWRRLDADPAWKALYPYRAYGGWGWVALFSKYPIETIPYQWAPWDPRDELLSATIQLPGQRVAVWLVHPPHPTRPSRYLSKRAFLTFLASHINRQQPSLVIGDMNMTPWSWDYRALLQRTGLESAETGFGFRPTWSPAIGFPPMLPIDHILLTGGWQVLNWQLGPNVGSDHVPVIATLILPAKKIVAKKL